MDGHRIRTDASAGHLDDQSAALTKGEEKWAQMTWLHGIAEKCDGGVLLFRYSR